MIPDDNRSQETQQELFTEFSSSPPKPERFPTLAKSHKPILISTTTEQILMVAILGVLVFCGVFFLGVLRGKSLRAPQTIVRELPEAAPVVVRTVAPAQARGIPASTARPQASSQANAVVKQPSLPPAAASNTEKPYTIQVVTHRKREYAENEMAAIRRMGYVSFLIPSGEYFQVCAGQYRTKDDAKKDLAAFSSKYKDCFLRRR